LATKSEGVWLIVRAVSFQDFQPMLSQITKAADRQTDGQTTCDPKTAHRRICTKVHCAVKTQMSELKVFYLLALLHGILSKFHTIDEEKINRSEQRLQTVTSWFRVVELQMISRYSHAQQFIRDHVRPRGKARLVERYFCFCP